ncbi:MAG TPA: T9SS type A sorting domain-containing protein, partial [Bacteroidia bacterium]|nr:T9SS type A sorting domain-containing protein [Bacteroidia bacterium]
KPLPSICLPETTVICQGNCVQLNGRAGSCKLTSANLTYSWAPTTGITGNPFSPFITACPTVTTVYTLTATNSVTLCSNSATTTVEVFPSTFTITGPTSVECGTVNTYSVTPVLPPPVTYVWQSTNPSATGTGTSANVSFSPYGGSISWEVSMPGCTSETTYSVGCGLPKGPEHNSGNTTTQFASNNVIVYPNPAGNTLNIQLELQVNQVLNMCIYNSLGEVVKCETLKDNLSAISINTLPAGIYFYRISDTTGSLIKADKLMIVH